MILVAAAGLSAGAVWWWMSRPADRPGWADRRAARLVGFGGSAEDAEGDFFAFAPSADATIREDRPSAAISVARLALAVALWTIVVVAAALAIGFLVKLQLDRYFLSGR